MRVEFLTPSETEFTEAIDYYNNESEGLGYEFAAEVKRTIERIIQYPNAWATVSKRTRPTLPHKQIPIWNTLSGKT